MKPLLGYGKVIFYLLFQKLAHVVDIDRFGKIDDVLHIQNAAVSFAAVAGGTACFKQHITVFLDEDDICVQIRYAQAHTVRACVHVQVYIQQLVALRLHDGHLARVHELGYLRDVLLLYIGQHLKLLVRVADRDARSDSGGDALQATRVRHDDAFDVFYNVAAYDYIDLLRHFAEHGAGLCRGVGHCDRLCAAHGGDKLLPENLQVLRIFDVGLYHIILSFDTIISTPIISPIFPFA